MELNRMNIEENFPIAAELLDIPITKFNTLYANSF